MWGMLVIALALVLGGGTIAALAQTDGGSVDVRDTLFPDANGQMISGLLYVPSTANAENPAPGILAVHGFGNSRETQDAAAIELSRRGYVVLAIDQPGHGRSDNPAFSGEFGGPASLAYLRSLAIVDQDNIGLTGHSLGGYAISAAAAAYPDGYQAMVLLDSSPGPAAAPDFPRNTLVVMGQWSEFAEAFWGAPPRQIADSEALQAFFSTDDTIVVDEVYGSFDDGTARMLANPLTNHPGTTHDLDTTQHIIEWFAQTLDGGREAPAQVWWVKEAGTLIAMVGGILAIFAVGGLLLATPFFSAMRVPVPRAAGNRWGVPWFVGAAVATAIPALTYFWFTKWGPLWIPAGPIFGQTYATAFAVWAVLNGIIGLAIMLVVRAIQRRRGSAAKLTVAEQGLGTPDGFRWSVVGKGALLALMSVGAAYLLVVLSNWLFTTDFRVYLLQFQEMSVARLSLYLIYMVPFTLFFLLLGYTMHNAQRWTGRPSTVRSEMLANAIVLPLGFVVLEAIVYIPMFATGALGLPGEGLMAIFGYPFIPVLFVVGLLSTYFFHKTGTIYAGAFASALFATWNIVGGTAIQSDIDDGTGLAQVLRIAIPVILTVVFVIIAIRLRGRAGRDGSPVTTEPAETVATRG